MRLTCITALSFVVGCASAASAQQQIAPDTFLDLAIGRTLTFSDYHSGMTVGVEEFLRRDLSVWAQENGRCSYGKVEIRGPLLCFNYENFPNPDNCWMPFQSEGELLVMSTLNRQIQRVTQYSKDPVVCEGVPLS